MWWCFDVFQIINNITVFNQYLKFKVAAAQALHIYKYFSADLHVYDKTIIKFCDHYTLACGLIALLL